MNKKMNNKGFSLVELIVVIAIMGILAVTLAPRLTQYIERSRRASDQEVVNTIYTAAKLANAEYPLGINKTVALDGDASVGGSTPADATGLFTQSTTDTSAWSLNEDFTGPTDDSQANFLSVMIPILQDFKLKAGCVENATTFTLLTDANGKITVTLDYNGTGTTDTATSKSITVAE